MTIATAIKYPASVRDMYNSIASHSGTDAAERYLEVQASIRVSGTRQPHKKSGRKERCFGYEARVEIAAWEVPMSRLKLDAVAEHANISPSWIYKNPDVRAVVAHVFEQRRILAA